MQLFFLYRQHYSRDVKGRLHCCTESASHSFRFAIASSCAEKSIEKLQPSLSSFYIFLRPLVTRPPSFFSYQYAHSIWQSASTEKTDASTAIHCSWFT